MMTDLNSVLAQIRPNDRVLDVGGGLHPLWRADAVLDANPFENSGEPIGTEPARYRKETWTVHDVNSRQAFPYRDGEFDFVFCSHLLEDIRDPIFVCQEIQRVGKRGYIETPSRAHESTPGIQSKYYTGYMHHRWFVETSGDGLVFTFKSPMLAEYPFLQCHNPQLPKAMRLFWEGRFSVTEKLLFHPHEIQNDLIAAAAAWQSDFSTEQFRERALRAINSHQYRRSLPERLLKRSATELLHLQRWLASKI